MSEATTLEWIRRVGLLPYVKLLKRLLVKLHLRPQTGSRYVHRNQAYRLLSGRGLEVGALHCPANLPKNCAVEYCDAHSKADSAKLFPEIEHGLLVEVDYLVNLDEDRLADKVKPSYDFVIMNHVIEHVANPLSVLEQLFTVIRPGGYVLVSAPDKRYTFDKPRQLTTFHHLYDEYQKGITVVDDEHYLDFIRHTAPEIFNSGDAERLAATLASVRNRREHAHVWDSESFLDFVTEAIRVLGLNAAVEFVSRADSNNIECFVMLRSTD